MFWNYVIEYQSMLLGRFMMLPEANCNSQTRKSNVTIVIVWWLNKSLLVWHYSIWGTRKNQQKFCLNWGLGGLFVKRCLGSSQFGQKSNFHQFFESIILTTIFLFLQHFPLLTRYFVTWCAIVHLREPALDLATSQNQFRRLCQLLRVVFCCCFF